MRVGGFAEAAGDAQASLFEDDDGRCDQVRLGDVGVMAVSGDVDAAGDGDRVERATREQLLEQFDDWGSDAGGVDRDLGSVAQRFVIYARGDPACEVAKGSPGEGSGRSARAQVDRSWLGVVLQQNDSGVVLGFADVDTDAVNLGFVTIGP